MPYTRVGKPNTAKLMVREGRGYPAHRTTRDGAIEILGTFIWRTILHSIRSAKGVPHKIYKFIAETVRDVAKQQQKP